MKKHKPTQTGGRCRPYFLFALLTAIGILAAVFFSAACTAPQAETPVVPQMSEVSTFITITVSVPPTEVISVSPSSPAVLPSASCTAVPCDSTTLTVSSTPFATTDPTPSHVPDFGYNDAIGWIRIDGTNIDYPIMYGEDYYYHTHNEDGERSESGSIYAYYNALCRNNVIAGHNARTSKTRFHQLHILQDRILSESEDGTAAKAYTIYCSLFGLETWRIFAMYETAADEPPSTLLYNIHSNCSNETTQWIRTQVERSSVDFGVVPNKQDRFLTLETCGDQYDSADAQSRLYIFLYCIDG